MVVIMCILLYGHMWLSGLCVNDEFLYVLINQRVHIIESKWYVLYYLIYDRSKTILMLCNNVLWAFVLQLLFWYPKWISAIIWTEFHMDSVFQDAVTSSTAGPIGQERDC